MQYFLYCARAQNQDLLDLAAQYGRHRWLCWFWQQAAEDSDKNIAAPLGTSIFTCNRAQYLKTEINSWGILVLSIWPCTSAAKRTAAVAVLSLATRQQRIMIKTLRTHFETFHFHGEPKSLSPLPLRMCFIFSFTFEKQYILIILTHMYGSFATFPFNIVSKFVFILTL